MNYPINFIIETTRCILRAPSLDDIPHIFAASQVKGFNDGMVWDPPSCEDELIPNHQSNLQAWEENRAYCFSLISKTTKDFLGRIAIRKHSESQRGIWDLGFFIVPQHQGNDYMTEAVRAIISFGFIELDAHKIVAAHAVWNKASERVMQKNGMRHLEYIPKGFQKNGKWVEENLLGITKVEWKELNAINLE